MTKIEKFEAVKAVVEQTGASAELVEFLDGEIARIEATAARRAEKRAEKKAEADTLKDAVQAQLTADAGKTAQEIADALAGEFEEITKGKVVSRMTKLIAEGVAAKSIVKTEDGKRVTVYGLVEVA